MNQKRNVQRGLAPSGELGGWTVVETLVALAIIALLAAIIWGACVEIHSHTLKHGVVVEKYYHAAWVQTTYTMINVGKGNEVMIPNTIYWPETWNVVMAGTNSTGEYLTRNLQASHSEYNEIKIGQRINAD